MRTPRRLSFARKSALYNSIADRRLSRLGLGFCFVTFRRYSIALCLIKSSSISFPVATTLEVAAEELELEATALEVTAFVLIVSPQHSNCWRADWYSVATTVASESFLLKVPYWASW